MNALATLIKLFTRPEKKNGNYSVNHTFKVEQTVTAILMITDIYLIADINQIYDIIDALGRASNTQTFYVEKIV